MEDNSAGIKDRISNLEQSLFVLELEEGQKSILQFLKAKILQIFKGKKINHEDVELFRRDNCRKTFRSSNALKKHKEDVHSEELQKCPYCREKFALHKKLIKHKLKAHRTQMKAEEPELLQMLKKQFENQ